jgi:hypothetical protein
MQVRDNTVPGPKFVGTLRPARWWAAAVLLLLWLGTWAVALLWVEVASDEATWGLAALTVVGVLVFVLPILAGALVGWWRQGHAPDELEPGPLTVGYYAWTESLAALAGAGVQLVNLAVTVAVSALQAELAHAGQRESWWEPLLVLLLVAIIGTVLGLVGGILGGLLAAGWRRVRHGVPRGVHPEQGRPPL